jgi:hypothetical protein
MRKSILSAVLLLVPQFVDAAVIHVDPDSFAAGTNISTAFPGVTLSLFDGPSDSGLPPAGASIFASDVSIPIGGNEVFGFQTTDGDLRPIFVLTLEGLQAQFSGPVGFVSIDFITDDSGDPGTLQAFDINGMLLEESFTPGVVLFGGVETATITRAQNDIAFIRAGGINSQGVYLDDLQYEVLAPATVPEPASVMMWVAGGALLLWRRRAIFAA